MRVQDARVAALAPDDRIQNSLATLMCGSGRSGASCHACTYCESRAGKTRAGFRAKFSESQIRAEGDRDGDGAPTGCDVRVVRFAEL